MKPQFHLFEYETLIETVDMNGFRPGQVRLNTMKYYYLVWQCAAILITVLLATFALFSLRSYLGDANISLLYLLIVLFCAATADPRATIFCGLISFFCYDFFLIPPVFDLRPDSPVKLLDPLAFLVVAIVTGILAERSRQAAVEKATYQQTSQFQATLLHLISHNLRTPLATIKTALSSLVASPDAPSHELLAVADHECDHLNRLIGNVLQLSRLDANAIQLRKDWNSLDEVVSSVFSRWRSEVAAKKLSAVFPTSLPLIQFDFELIESVVTNLVENAFRHGIPPVVIGIEPQPREVYVWVQDGGSGIPPEAKKLLFQQFSTTKSGGLGLGLAVCKGLLAAHGGKIWVDPAVLQTRFVFNLPLLPYQSDDDDGDGDEPHTDR